MMLVRGGTSCKLAPAGAGSTLHFALVGCFPPDNSRQLLSGEKHLTGAE